MDDFRITGLGDGFLIGITYFPKGDRNKASKTKIGLN